MAGLMDANLDEIPDEMFEKMGITRENFAEIRKMMAAREANTPAVGDLAPDFEIERLSREGQRTGATFRLSENRGRPVALVFGSYT